jgi:serine/threonine protein kinase
MPGVAAWCEAMSTPELLRGLRMGETLGVGSFGEVRVGTLPSGEHVAVKVMDPRKLTGTSLTEMRNEVNALAKLEHPHVIRYYGMATDGSCTSRWCNDQYCGCLDLDADESGTCIKCGHSVACHAPSPDTRATVTIVQELAAGGDLVSLLFTSSLGYRMDDIIPRSYDTVSAPFTFFGPNS